MAGMSDMSSIGKFVSGCVCCKPTSVSRRQFLCSTAAVAAAATAIAASFTTPAAAQPARAPAAGRPILIKGGCVLSLDRAVGDFEQADVLIRGSNIADVRPN